MKKKEFLVIEQGHGGVTGYSIPPKGQGQGHTAGYAPLKDWYVRGKEKCWFIDITVIDYDKLIGLALDGPLLDTRLKQRDPFTTEISPFLVGGLQGEFYSFAAMKIAKPSWTGLDMVGINEYVEYWRQAGARIGRRKGNEIIWENELFSDEIME